MKPSIWRRIFSWLARAHERREAIRQLSVLSDHYLRDVGIERGEIRGRIDGRLDLYGMPGSRHNPRQQQGEGPLAIQYRVRRPARTA